MAATHIVTIHTFDPEQGKPRITSQFADSYESATILAERIYSLGGNDVYVSEIKKTKYGKRG